FVRLGGWTSSPDYNSVACEPFWEQIFDGKDNMNNFIDSLPTSIPKINLMKNFWKLYQNNNYKMIEFHGQGNVEEKIKNNLDNEVNDLNTLLEIEREFDELETERANSPRKKDNEFYKRKYDAFLNHIMKINLYIYIRNIFIEKIQSAIRSM
ncbi:MAG: hypothetical protein LBE56_07480, partial [Tannerella sp.]|nr:hypothetical protein [Tannerella sp.]